MFTVIKLGGCNGSGKTMVARGIIDLTNAVPKWSRKTHKNPDYYVGQYKGREVLILGSYENACGGMDTIADKMKRLELIQWACKGERLIFFEGLITGKTYGAIGAISEAHIGAGRGVWLYAFMDTPFDVCVQRVRDRRVAKGNNAVFDPERTMRQTFKICQSLAHKLKAGLLFTHSTHTVAHTRRPATAARTLLDAAVALLGDGR